MNTHPHTMQSNKAEAAITAPAKVKTDRRTVRTEAALTQALCELAMEKPLAKITIREIADRADVSRGAFYLHFSDIFDMYEKIEDTVIRNLNGLFAAYYESMDDADYERLIDRIISYIEQERALFQMLFSMQSFRSRMSDLLKDFSLSIWNKYLQRDISSDRFEYLIRYHTQGILTCIDSWLKQNPPCTNEDLKDLIILLDNSFDEIAEKICL